MSSDDIETIMQSYDKWDEKNARLNFVYRMEHKLRRKERRG
jgi:hypothetical protein